jgi:hypothetical protein
MNWEQLYNFLGIKDFIYFISSPAIQDMLFPVKLVFIAFAFFFLALVIYFMINSSWLQYKFLEDVTEFFSWQSYGMRQISKRLNKIKNRIKSGSDAEYKLAIIEAEDFLGEILDEAGYEGENFEEIAEKASKLLGSLFNDVLNAHQVRNSIVYDPDYKLTAENAKKVLLVYESAINSVGIT